MKVTTQWYDIKETPPEKSEFCYFTDGKTVAVGVWLNDCIVLKGRVKKPKKWAPFQGAIPKT